MDARLYAHTTNVVVSIAQGISLAVASLASPQVAHTGYETDECVLNLMTHGLGTAQPPTGCSWLQPAPESAAIDPGLVKPVARRADTNKKLP